jgi:hypothetical protein
MADEEIFSEHPEENFRIENEILKIKLKAQFGDAFDMQTFAEMPAEIENQFLKSIIDFEERAADTEAVSVYEKIGEPTFKSWTELDSLSIKPELERILDILEEHDINLHFNQGPYSDELMYKFITEEFFNKEVSVFNHFIYEEYHPNHEADIKEACHKFLQHWFSRKFDEYSTELASEFTHPSGVNLTEAEMMHKIQLFFDAFPVFKDDGYNIDETGFELSGDDEDQGGFGFAEGMLKYDAVMENGEGIHFEGPYKLYMSLSYGIWQIFYFVMPGFDW